MALDNVDVVGSPAWWMQTLARQLLDAARVKRLATLDAYRSGCPPMPYLAPSERKGFYEFTRLTRTNYARTIVRAPAERMAVRSIRTAAANDDDGDQVAWRYWTANSLDIDSTDVHSDMLTFSEAYVRVSVAADGRPLAMRCDPRYTITAQDPLNPHRTIAAFYLVWDEWAGKDFAYLWLPGEQWVAERPRRTRPPALGISGITTTAARRFGYYWPRLSFDTGSFTMRPVRPDAGTPQADEFTDDDGPYSETYSTQTVPVVRFANRDGVGEFEEHLDLLDRIYHTIMTRVVVAAVQAYKQRALKQDLPAAGEDTADRLPDKDPDTGEVINWDDIFQPGPDALWKLPPGVSIWESTEVQLDPITKAAESDVKMLSATTDTPFVLMSDDTNQSAESAQLRREGQVFKVEDRGRIAGRCWADVISLMFQFAPDGDRYDENHSDRADAGQVVIDWMPAERFSLSEKSQADSANKTLSPAMAAVKIWQLSPAEVAMNEAQRAADALLAPLPGGTGGAAA